jgi:hypothetical protein
MSESQDPEGAAERPPIIDHVPESEPASEPKFAAPEEPAALARPQEPSMQVGGGPVPPNAGAAPSATPAPRRGGTPLPLTLLLFLALAGGNYWTWTHPQSAPPPHDDPQPAIDAVKSELADKLQALAARIDTLEKQSGTAADAGKRLDDIAATQTQLAAAVQKLQQDAAQKPAGEPALAATPPVQPAQSGDAQQNADLSSKLDQALTQEKASLDAIDQRLGKLEQANGAATQAQDNKQTIDTLASRVEKLEQGEAQIAGVKQDATLAVKLSAAQVALSSGQPLGALPGAPEALARFANSAPPTEESLRADFPAVAKAVLDASRPEESEKSLFSRAMARLEQTITLRQGDRVIVGDPAAGVVATAQQDLNNDNLQGAVDALATLNGRAAQAADHWLIQARSLLAARAALAQLAAHG